MRLPCTVSIVNRLSFGSMAGIVKPSKGIVHLFTDSFSSSQRAPMIIISTAKEIQSHKYNVSNLETIRERFIEDGQVTLEMRAPQVTLMISKASVDKLKKFINLIKEARDGKTPEVRSSSSPLTPTTATSSAPKSIPNSSASGSSSSVRSSCPSSAVVPKSGQNRKQQMDASPSSKSSAGTSCSNSNKANQEHSQQRTLRVAVAGPSGSSSAVFPNLHSGSRDLKRKLQATASTSTHTAVPLESSTGRSAAVDGGNSLRTFLKVVRRNPISEAPAQQEDPVPATSNRSWSRSEVQESRKLIRTNPEELKVSKRENYPLKSGFHPKLVNLQLTGCSLSRIDSRILELKFLRTLNLTSNSIFAIDKLKSLSSVLNSLTLDNNKLERIPDDFFTSPAINSISFLSMKGNQLRSLPDSIVELKNLVTLILSENQLRYLPYDLHKLNKLMKLSLAENQLTFVPFTILLMKLIKLDMSRNNFPPTTAARPVAETTKKVQLETFTTLYERAASVLKTHNHRNRLVSTKCIDLEGIPVSVRRFLETCKFCMTCGRYSPRYSLLVGQLTVTDMALETVSSNFTVPAKTVLCDLCSSS